MANFWLKLKIWTKIILSGLIAIYVLAFILENHGNEAKLWIFPNKSYDSTTLVVAFFAFLAGMIVIAEEENRCTASKLSVRGIEFPLEHRGV